MKEQTTFPMMDDSVFASLKNIKKPYSGRLPQNYLAYAWARIARQAMIDAVAGNTKNDDTVMEVCHELQDNCFPKLKELGATPISFSIKNPTTGEVESAEGLMYQGFLFAPLWDNTAGPEYYQYIQAYYERVLLEEPGTDAFYAKNPNDYLYFSTACKLVSDFGKYGYNEHFENIPVNARLNQLLNIRSEEKIALSYYLKTDYREKQLLLPILRKNVMLAPVDVPIQLDSLDVKERLEEVATEQLTREYGKVSDVTVLFPPQVYNFLEMVSELQPAGIMIEGESTPVPAYLHPDGRVFTEIELIHMADVQPVKVAFNYLMGVGVDRHPCGDDYVEEETENWNCEVWDTTLNELSFDISDYLPYNETKNSQQKGEVEYRDAP